jgi:uncharacterized integral membrane protein
MNIVTLIILGFIGFIILGLVIIFLINRKRILSFWFPQKWVIVCMLELDNNVNEWLQEKNEDLRFLFNNGYYFLYHQGITEEVKDDKGKVLFKRELTRPAIYREGRLAKFFYHEGNSEPMDFRLGTITGNPQISRQMETMEVSKLFEDNSNGAKEFMNKYGIYILVGIAILVLYLVFKKTPQPEQIPIVKGG